MTYRRFDTLCGAVAMAIAAAFGCAFIARGGEAQASQAPPPKIELLNTEADAVGWALTALLEYPEAARPTVRFVWIPPYGDKEWIGAVNFAMNAACSHSRVLHRGRPFAQGYLLGFDFAQLVPEPDLRAKVLAVYDGLAVDDPVFHISQVNVAEVDAAGQTQPPTKPVVILAPHLQDALAKHAGDDAKSKRLDVMVTQLTSSTGAIYRADFVLEQVLTSLRGKYPELRQFPLAKPADGSKPVNDLLAKRGFFLGHSRDFGGEKGAVLLQSGVTGSGRVVLVAPGLASRLPLAVTFDQKDSQARPDRQFIRNLIEFEPFSDASELLIGMPNGLMEFALADSAGNIQRSAPSNIVADSTKPDGHTKELEGAMSCIVCHAPEKGYRTARNDMEFFQGADTDFFGDGPQTYTKVDGTKMTLTREEAVALVASRYGDRIDDPEGPLGRARRDYVYAVTQLTDYPLTADGPSSVQLVGEKIKEIYHGWRYRTVDAERACLELGVRVSADQAVATLRKLCPPPAAGEQEDVVIALLRNGAPIKRDDFNAVYSEMARRAMVNRNSLVGK